MTHDTTQSSGTLRSRLPRIRPKLLGIAAVAAMALFLAALAFTLSFDALRALAIEINVDPSRAWMAPVAIDVAQAAATAGYVIFRVSGKYRYARFYCAALAIVTVGLSVVGNAYHSYQMAAYNIARVAAGEDIGFVPQPPGIAAIIAAIFPLLWLALFHLFTMMLQLVIDERAHDRLAQETQQSAGHRVDGAASTDGVSEAVLDDGQTIPVVALEGHVPAADAYDETDALLTPFGAEFTDATARSVVATHDSRVANPIFADQSADGTTRNGYPQTREGLLRFLENSNFHETVKVVAAMLVNESQLKQIDVAQRLQLDKSTISRRWRQFRTAAEAEGFSVPPLPTAEFGERVREMQGV